MRVALLTNIVPPYRIPVYQALAATPGWTLRVFVSADSEFDRSWRVDAGGLDVVCVRSASLRRRVRTRGPARFEQVVTLHVPIGLPAALADFAPDVVVSGELGFRTLLALLYSRLARVPLVIWSYHSRVSATAAGPLKRRLRQMLLARARAVVGMGSQARAVLAELGVPEARLFDAPNACDHDALAKALAGIDVEARREAVIRAVGARERIALFAGRLVPMKGIDPLLRAWARLPEALRAGWSLVFVGSGPLAARIAAARAAAEPGEIVQVPALQPRDLVGFYAAAELLVFPSLGDPWGLVVNEAFACGRPVLCSRRAGCADDLIRPGENGWLFDPTDDDGFACALGEALASPDGARLGAGARATAERFRPQRMAEGLRRAILYATGA
jgi:glycosyltransferase involved in cell wall biosynthesis